MSTRPQPETEEINVVLVGSFNPGIFHPEWFRRQEILLPAEAEAAKVHAVTPEFSQIRFLDMGLDVFPDRFILRTHDSSRSEKLQDVVMAVLRKLYHTPISAVGINSDIQFDLQDEKYWHKIGHSLAPKDLVWNKIFARPGMESLSIKDLREGDFPGYTVATVQPCKPPSKIVFGVKISSNYHYDVPKASDKPRSEIAVEFLSTEWKSAIAQTRQVAYSVFESIPKDAD
jgi:hypothetical protein